MLQSLSRGALSAGGSLFGVLVPAVCGGHTSFKMGLRWFTEPAPPVYDALEESHVSIVTKTGADILNDPVYNKGTAFPYAERERLKLRGLLPPRLFTDEDQEKKVMDQYRYGMDLVDPEQVEEGGITRDMVRKWEVLQALQDRNETLFYKVLMDNFVEMAPIIYTPTVGWVCVNYHRLYQKPRGMYFTPKDTGHMASMMWNWPAKEVDAVVVTDGSRILGLGDLGCNGIGIPIGKLDLYVAGGGFHPGRVLPCVLDVGTDNELLRNDPIYAGVREPRLNGDSYYKVVDEFVRAVYSRWPKAILQFEDFSYHHAQPLLERYRHNHLVFNDDIQGTAAVAVAGLYGSLQALDLPSHAICDQKIFIVGAGSAGMGVASLIQKGMVRRGLSEEEAFGRFWLFDHNGLITQNRDDIEAIHVPFARKDTESKEGEPVSEVLNRVGPSVLIGLAGAGKLFTEEMLVAMGKFNERPIIMPMSNPTVKMECTAEEAQRCTQGRAIFASGSPQRAVEMNGRTIASSQANNMYIFPGLALGAFLGQTGTITDNMIMTAAECLPHMVEEQDRKMGSVYPKLSQIRHIGAHVASNVIIAAAEEGQLRGEAVRYLAHGKQCLEEWVQRKMFTPKYTSLVNPPRGAL